MQRAGPILSGCETQTKPHAGIEREYIRHSASYCAGNNGKSFFDWQKSFFDESDCKAACDATKCACFDVSKLPSDANIRCRLTNHSNQTTPISNVTSISLAYSRSDWKSSLLECWRGATRHRLRDRSGNVCINGALVPRLFILGCQKCGSTSLYFDLTNVFRNVAKYSPGGVVTTVNAATKKSPEYSHGKELHFFGTNRYVLGCQQYLGLMPACPPTDYASPAVVIDATPNYLFSNTAPEEVKVLRIVSLPPALGVNAQCCRSGSAQFLCRRFMGHLRANCFL